MLSVSLVSLTLFKLGPSVTAIGHLGQGAATEPPRGLVVPWQDLHPKATIFALLSWRGRISKFDGTLGVVLRSSGDNTPAIAAFREGIERLKPHVKNSTRSPLARLLASLERELKRTEEGTAPADGDPRA